MSYIMFAFIAMRKSVARLKREAHPKRILTGGLVALALYTGIWAVLWKDAVRRGSFKCVIGQHKNWLGIYCIY
jgi:hypothetical protein